MRALTVHSSFEALRKEAKAWRKALRAGDGDALQRLRAALPDVPVDAGVGLRTVQLAVAREHGLPGWAALREALADLADDRRDRAELVDEVLRAAWGGDGIAARRILSRRPELVRGSVHLAAMAGDLDEVRRLSAEASLRGGPLGWEALQYLAYGRLDDGRHTVEIATRLLDAGADVRARFDDGWGNAYTLLNGAIGQGEADRPEHPRAEALVRLFLARGAPAFDVQVLYDTSLSRDDTRWLDLLWDGTWTGEVLGLPVLDYLLGNAVERDHRRRAAWLLDRGADPNAVHGYSRAPLHAHAQLYGLAEVATLLEARGAAPVRLSGRQAFQAAALRGDADEARRIAAADPTVRADPHALAVAAQRGLDDAVALLLELGVPVDVHPHDGKRALHWAAQGGWAAVVRRLLAAGADVDRRGGPYAATPLGFALHFGRRAVVELLVPRTRDVFGLARAAAVARLDEVLRAEPSLAHARDPRGASPLFALPDDESAAVEVLEVLLAHGADPRAVDAEGRAPAQAARKRGLIDAAELLAP